MADAPQPLIKWSESTSGRAIITSVIMTAIGVASLPASFCIGQSSLYPLQARVYVDNFIYLPFFILMGVPFLFLALPAWIPLGVVYGWILSLITVLQKRFRFRPVTCIGYSFTAMYLISVIYGLILTRMGILLSVGGNFSSFALWVLITVMPEIVCGSLYFSIGYKLHPLFGLNKRTLYFGISFYILFYICTVGSVLYH